MESLDFTGILYSAKNSNNRFSTNTEKILGQFVQVPHIVLSLW